MGLFSGKTIISVSSSVYNLAGDETDRPIFLKNMIIRNVLSGTKKSLGDTIPVGYLRGPGIKLRSFFRWALDNYDLIGMPSGQMYANDILDTSDIAQEIPKAAGETIWVQSAKLADSDYEIWADQYMLENHSELFNTEWSADMVDATKTITITFADPLMPPESFVATNFVTGAKYIYAYYTRSILNNPDPVIQGTLFLLGSDLFPLVADYALLSTSTVTRTETLVTDVTVTKTYSDATPPEMLHTTSSVDEDVDLVTDVYIKTEYVGNDPVNDAKISMKYIRNLVTDLEIETEVNTSKITETLANGVIKTTTTITTQDILVDNNSYRDDTQRIVKQSWNNIAAFIYQVGSGNAVLDVLVEQVDDYGKFFPMIPFRVNNEFVTGDVYNLSKKAFKKTTDGGKYNKVKNDLAESSQIGDMDYIYTVFGVSLNCLDRSARRYLYEFFTRMALTQKGGPNSGAQFVADMAAYKTAYDEWLAWRNSNKQALRPPIPSKPSLPNNELIIQNLGENAAININYDVRLSWNFISNGGDHIGLGKPTAKKNDLWLEYRGSTSVPDPIYTNGLFSNLSSTGTTSYDTIRIWWQFEDDQYRYIDIAGLVHKNFIYAGKHVTITAKEALEDGEESGFIVPLHFGTFYSMPLVHATQMSTACVFLVINSYQVKKTKWWESWFFRIIFVIVIAIVSVLLTGGAGIGLLGSHVAVGSTLGLSGISAAIAGSVANALAALVLTTVLEKVASSLGAFGSIISTILGIVLTGAIQSFSAGNGFTFNFSQLMRADNIMKLMDAVGNGYSSYIQTSIGSMQEQLVQLQETTNAELRRVREQYASQFGTGSGQIDPTMFISGNNPAQYVEMRDTFLARTLMTGSDVATMSVDLLNNMADLTLTLPNAFST